MKYWGLDYYDSGLRLQPPQPTDGNDALSACKIRALLCSTLIRPFESTCTFRVFILKDRRQTREIIATRTLLF